MEKTVAAISTAIGESGIGIVRMTGPMAFSIGKKVFRDFKDEKIENTKNRYLQYGHIYDGDTMVDEVLISFMQAPNTYTREDIVEIYCHGGSMAVRKTLNLLLKEGAYLAERGEFTKRAFLNGRLDLSQAEAVIGLIDAKTDKAYEASLNQLQGGLKEAIGKIKEDVLAMLARVEYSINFMEDLQDELPIEPILERGCRVIEEMDKLINSSNKGRIIREGIKTVIIGKPNVGKSSLLNALLKENRAIVTDIPGTTRDTIEEYIDLAGVSIKIIDTAGIRNTEDLVESIGVNKSIEFAEQADLVIAIFDMSRSLDEEDEKIIDLTKKTKTIVLLNKNDLESVADKSYILDRLKGHKIIDSSIIENRGVKDLEDAIIDMFFDGEVVISDTAMVTGLRHKKLLEDARKNIASALEDIKRGFSMDAIEIDLRTAYSQLGEITGESIEEDVLNKIFRDFCIGK